ncbi:M14 family metallopeptidase [uncultured Ramlibacter sp.]|uniref:M14 family metallopeptidase n=1 Tax=uncultured Ramlibacter sp. TaxID=260755 RepID=UPI002607C154|nr:M14 family metallopeptidase [uncultured Ramlibacter sp.]
MTGAHDAFSSTYAQARAKFLHAAADAGVQVDSRPHPLPGRDGEELAMDVALDGDALASSLLILTSACHGVEGYCGTGVQVAALRDRAWRDHARSRGVAVLYIHALNPYGFSHIRRTTHENVDLNRNFHDFSRPLPDNTAYRELQALLLPAQWPPSDDNNAAISQYIATHGEPAYQAAISRGQHEFPGGLFFGGTGPTWSNSTLREVLRSYGSKASRIGWIDIHTGLGPSGLGERIYAGADDDAAVQRARSWWDGGGRTPVTSIYDGSSSSAFLTGLMWNSVYEECPQAQYTGIAMEYGTVPVLEVMHALRGEHWLNLHPDAPPALAAQVKQQMKDAFYTDTDSWKEQILQQASESLYQAADGLQG